MEATKLVSRLRGNDKVSLTARRIARMMRIGLLLACILSAPFNLAAEELRSGLDKKFIDPAVRVQDN